MAFIAKLKLECSRGTIVCYVSLCKTGSSRLVGRLLAFSVEFCIITSFQKINSQAIHHNISSSRFAFLEIFCWHLVSLIRGKPPVSTLKIYLLMEKLPSQHLLLEHYGAEKSAETLQGEIKSKEPMISSDVTTEWSILHG